MKATNKAPGPSMLRQRRGGWLLLVLVSCWLLSACSGERAEPPALPEEHYQKAITSSELGDMDEAVFEIRQAIRNAPQNAEYRWFLSTLMLERGDPTGAELVLRRMITLGITHPDLRIRLARLLYMLNKHDELLAEELPEYTTDNSGELAALHYMRGKSLSRRNWVDESREAFLTSLQLYDTAQSTANVSGESMVLRRELWLLQESNEDLKAASQHATCRVNLKKAKLQRYDMPDRVSARVLKVGPNERYKRPSEAAAVAKDGDIIEIAPGRYENDPVVWRQNRLILRATSKDRDQRPHMVAGPVLADGKAIWTFYGDNIIVDSIEFSGAKNRENNGAGIRFEGVTLTVVNSYFHHNQNGILTRGRLLSVVHIEFSEFGHNGAGDGFSHNIYVGNEARLVFRYNYSHHANAGHLLKSRAKENDIRSNRLSDEEEGLTSYLIDLPDGGLASIVGNVMFQSFRPQNETLISYGAESVMSPSMLNVVNNTAYNQSVNGVFVYNHSNLAVVIANNLFFGTNGKLNEGVARLATNMVAPLARVRDFETLDFHLRPDSRLIDKGSEYPIRGSLSLMAESEYVHPANATPRAKAWKPDIGAYEYCR